MYIFGKNLRQANDSVKKSLVKTYYHHNDLAKTAKQDITEKKQESSEDLP